MEASDTQPTLEQREQELAAREAALAEREKAATTPDNASSDNVQEGVVGGQVPKVDHPPETPEEVQKLADAFAEYRREVAALRNELAAHRQRPPVTEVPAETLEQRRNARLEAIAQHSHYCPGCGRLGKYAQRCEGTAAGPHAPIEMVVTDELGGDPADHTAAPSTDSDELAA